MSKEIQMTIDGVQITAREGQSVLEAALENGIYIPNLCHHPDLEPIGVCRLCIVEIEGRRPQVSCKTLAEDGMVITTESEYINNVRI